MAALYADESQYDEVEALCSKALEAERRVLGTGHPDTLSSGDGLARVQLRKHEYVEAETTLRDALRGYDRPRPTNTIFHDRPGERCSSEDATRNVWSGLRGSKPIDRIFLNR